MDTTYKFVPQDDGRIRVDAYHQCTPDCPKVFEGVAYIWEPESPNPGVSVPRVLGVNGLYDICTLIIARRHME